MTLPLSPMEMLTLIKGIVTLLNEAAQAPQEFVQLQRTLGYVSELLSWMMDQDLTADEELEFGDWWRNCRECLGKTADCLKAHARVQSDGIVGFYARVRWNFTDAKRLNADLEGQMLAFVAYVQLLQTERR